MDFKALRAKRNDKARSLIESSGGKVDASTWTPDEPLNTEAKTGMRPISRRAFKAGGKVDGDEAKTNLSRAPRGFKETVGLANTNQKDANEEREGKKHVGGMKKGGRVAKNNGGYFAPTTSLRPRPRPTPSDIGSSEQDGMPEDDGNFSSVLAPKKSLRPMKRPVDMGLTEGEKESIRKGTETLPDYYKKGGMVEGSAKDKRRQEAGQDAWHVHEGLGEVHGGQEARRAKTHCQNGRRQG